MGDSEKVKPVTIYVNTRPEQWSKDEITYDDLVKLFLQGQSNPANARYTIVYSKGVEAKPKGKINPNESVKAKDGMRFDVDQTLES